MDGITRIRPVDLLEVMNVLGDDVTVAEAIEQMQDEDQLTFNCPKCLANGQPTGYITVKVTGGTIKAICDICVGYLKTNVKYIADPNRTGNYIIDLAPPNEQEPG